MSTLCRQRRGLAASVRPGFASRLLAILCLLSAGGSGFLARGETVVAGSPAAGILAAYSNRLPTIRAQFPAIIRAAEAAAARKLAATNVLIVTTHRDQAGFAAELMARAGGLSEMGSLEVRNTTTNNIGLSCVRAWDGDNVKLQALLTRARQAGMLIIVFASTNGLPADFPADFVIDNGATSPAAAEAAVNALVNVSGAWVWTCEYAAALTRRGKRPGILKSISYPDGQEFNAMVRANRSGLWDHDGSIPPGELGRVYLGRLDRLVRDLAADPVQTQIRAAAAIVARRIREGRPVWAATCTHFLKDEIRLDLKSPFKPFRPYNNGFAEHLKPGDLLLWMGYIGVDTARYRHSEAIRQTGADLIACFVPDQDPTNNAPDALARIEQPWELGDAEVAIPFPPGRMAPVSGIAVALQYRMLDEAVAARLQTSHEE